MNVSTRKIKAIFITTALLILAGVASACVPTENILPGVAGFETEMPAPEPEVEALPTEPPTPTPVPPPFGHIVFVSNRDGQMNLYMTTPDGADVTRLTNAGFEDSTPRLSPDGTRVAFVSTVNGNMDVYVLDLLSRAITRITDAIEKDSSPSWSPDGVRLVFESFRDRNFEIYIANADGSNQIRLTDDPAGDTSPAWSPNDNLIAFVSNRFGNSNILLLTPNGSVSSLTTSRASDSTPAWSPNGNMVAFKTSAADTSLSDICLINRDGLGERCLTEIPAEYSSPVWSPNGEWLAATVKQGSQYGIHIFNVNDNTVVKLSAEGVEPRGIPAWSPDGIRLAFQAQVDGNMEIYTVLIATSEFTRITFHPAHDGSPVWTAR
jgi:Tol biopolymer transport system component